MFYGFLKCDFSAEVTNSAVKITANMAANLSPAASAAGERCFIQ